MVLNLNLNTYVQGAIEVSVLLGIVLLLRKPIARYFGSQATYALWFLPVAGFMLPRIPIKTHDMVMPTQIVTAYTSITENEIVRPFVYKADVSLPLLIYAFLAWVVIGVLWLVFHLLTYRYHYKNNQLNSLPIDPKLAVLAANVARDIGLKRMPAVRICVQGGTPSVMGLFKPMIVLPQSFSASYNSVEQRLVLAHEMMHIKRRDLWAGFGALLFRAVNWPNPLAHIAIYFFRTDQEAACDSSVVSVMSGKNIRSEYMKTVMKTANPCTGV